MSRLTSVLSEAIRIGGNEGISAIQKLRNPLLYKHEIEVIDWIEDHYKTYGAMPTLDSFKDTYITHYTERFKGEKLLYLLEKYYEDVRSEEMMKISNKIAEQVGSGVDVDAEEYIRAIGNLPVFVSQPITDLFSEFEDDFDNLYGGHSKSDGFQIGFRDFQDDAIGNLSAGRIMAFLAHTKSGKTTVLSILTVKAFLEHKKVLYLTYEMPVREIKEKVHACLGSFDTKSYAAITGTPEHTELVDKGNYVKDLLHFHTVSGGKLVIKRGVSLSQMKDMLIREKKETGKSFDIVIVDGIYLIPSGAKNEEEKWRSVESNAEMLRQYVMGDGEDLDPFACIFSSQLDPKSEDKGIGVNKNDVAKSRALVEIPDVVLAMVKDKDFAPNGRIIFPLENRKGGAGINYKAEIEIDFESTMIKINKKSSSPLGGVYEKLMDIRYVLSSSVSEIDDEDEDKEETNELIVGSSGYLLDGNNEEYVTEEMFDSKG